ncbi:MAG: alpha/beta hydrolase [Bacilli bacterium]|nr:alpha/beta hydrolase [Clostridium sp.]MDY6015582.1 alpha/beta hydrolase [Bacilli bacterium]
MTINIRNININYIQYGSGSDVVLLHGWGQNIAMMKPIGDRLQKNHRITILDFPGFGESEEPKTALTVYDYCEILEELLKKLKVKKPVIMGHSFGGRIAIIYASRNEVEKVVLFGSPCIRKEVKPSLKLRMLKSLKKIPGINKLEGFAKNHMGSRDYKNASEIMKKILVNVVNEDLSECAKKINVPTLLIWGDRDTEAPVEDAKELEKIIPDAGLIVLPNSTHYAYLENLPQVINILNNFL